MSQVKKANTGDACLDTFQHWVGSNEVLRSTFQMTTVAERGRNQECHLHGWCDRQEHSALIPWPVLVVFTLESESCPGEGEKGRAPH